MSFVVRAHARMQSILARLQMSDALATAETAIPPRDSLNHEDSSRTELISFAIGNEQYGVDIMAVREIKGWSDITHLPRQPDYVRGVLNLRGIMVPIIDLRSRFGEGMTEATPLHIVIIVQAGVRQVGLLADRVLDIVAFENSQVQPVPHVSGQSALSFLRGLINCDAGMIALIDIDSLLEMNDVPATAAAA
jgi:purine-binding chemotaxis protein CheW